MNYLGDRSGLEFGGHLLCPHPIHAKTELSGGDHGPKETLAVSSRSRPRSDSQPPLSAVFQMDWTMRWNLPEGRSSNKTEILYLSLSPLQAPFSLTTKQNSSQAASLMLLAPDLNTQLFCICV